MSICSVHTALECTSDEQCAPTLACAGGRCADPCARGGPCGNGQHCAVLNHQPVCSKGTTVLLPFFKENNIYA